MKRLFVLVLVAGAVTLGGSDAFAHHSFSATYIEGKSVTIEGELVQFQFRNPHSFVHVTVKEADGTTIRYAVEWGGTNQLDGAGVTRETLKPGDIVVITGSPARNPAERRIRMVTLLRPKDGYKWGGKPGEVVD